MSNRWNTFGPVDPTHLEELGKAAAVLSDTSNMSLTKAVIETIGMEKLNSEQVRRVVEHANHEAFNRKYSSLAADMRVVDIDGGPADPNAVLRALNIAAAPREVRMESLDYSYAPQHKTAALGNSIEKIASRTVDGVRQDVYGLRGKLAAAHEEIVGQRDASKLLLNDAFVRLHEAVKSAALEGATREDLWESWSRIDAEAARSAYQKLAQLCPPRDRGVKVSHQINPAHAVVTRFSEFSKHAQDFVTRETARRNLELQMTEIDGYLKAVS